MATVIYRKSFNRMNVPCFTPLSMDNLKFIKSVGKGAYSEVGLYENLETGQLMALKVYNVERADERYEIDFMKEIAIVGTLNFPSIIKLYGFVAPNENQKFAYALEYMENGNLDDLLCEMQMGIDHPEFGPTEKMIVLVGVAFALNYMHNHAVKNGSVMHRDIKAGNVLLDGKMRPKLADFGFAKVITDGLPNTPNRGSWPWMAPEVMMGENYSTKADVYSFGMFMYEVITHITPFVHLMTSREIIHAVTVKKERPVVPDPDLGIVSVMRACWNDDPAERPTMAEVCAMLVTETIHLPGADIAETLAYIAEIGAEKFF